jgi:hypothetical protein
LAIGIIEGEKQGVHLTQDLFIGNSAFPHVIFKRPRSVRVFSYLSSFTLDFTQRRSHPSIDLGQHHTSGIRNAPQRNVRRWRFGREKHSQNKPSGTSYEASSTNPRSQLLETSQEIDEPGW